jgi:hypothetical protein
MGFFGKVSWPRNVQISVLTVYDEHQHRHRHRHRHGHGHGHGHGLGHGKGHRFGNTDTDMDMIKKFIYKYRIAPKPGCAYTGIDLNVN